MDPYLPIAILGGAVSLGIAIPYFTREFTQLSLLEQRVAEYIADTAKENASPEWTKGEFYSAGRTYLKGLEDAVNGPSSSPVAEKDTLPGIFYSKGYTFGLNERDEQMSKEHMFWQSVLRMLSDGYENKPPKLHSWKILRRAYRDFRKKETGPRVIIR